MTDDDDDDNRAQLEASFHFTPLRRMWRTMYGRPGMKRRSRKDSCNVLGKSTDLSNNRFKHEFQDPSATATGSVSPSKVSLKAFMDGFMDGWLVGWLVSENQEVTCTKMLRFSLFFFCLRSTVRRLDFSKEKERTKIVISRNDDTNLSIASEEKASRKDEGK